MVSLPIVETVVHFITAALTAGGLAALVGLMAVESWGIPPLPSEVILLFGGFLIAQGTFSWTGAILAAMLGGLIGSYVAYAVGRWGRGWLTRTGTGGLRIDPKHLDAMDRWFARHGEGTVIVARLLPVARSYISFPAGTAKMEPARFGAYTLVGAFPFTVALLYAGYVLREHWQVIVPYFTYGDYAVVGAIVLALVYVALRWRGVLGPGIPPRLIRSSGSPPPAEGARPSPTDPGSPGS